MNIKFIMAIKKILNITNLLLYCFTFILILPFLYFYRLQRYDPKVNIVLVSGIMRLWAGITSIADGLNEYNIKTIFYYQKVKDYYSLKIHSNHLVIISSSLYLKAILQFLSALIKHKPAHVEMYFHVNHLLILGQVLILKVLDVTFVSVFTGGEILYWNKHSYLKKKVVKLASKYSEKIIYKELYMKRIIQENKICELSKLVFIHNAIILKDEPEYRKDKREILFLNTFKKWRNLELLIDSIPKVILRFPDAKFKLVGKIGRNNEEDLENIKYKKGLDKVVDILPFSKETRKYYDSASVFILPADIVFLNNSLLEAMERGIPPIISNVEGSTDIINNGHDGLIVNKEKDEIANAIIELLSNEEKRVQMGIRAREKIKNKFDEKVRTKKLIQIYKILWSKYDGV